MSADREAMGRRLWAAMERHGEAAPECSARCTLPIPDKPFLLVETNGVSGDHWYSFHSAVEAAMEYQLDQEDASVWDLEAIYDLRDGSRMDVEVVRDLVVTRIAWDLDAPPAPSPEEVHEAELRAMAKRAREMGAHTAADALDATIARAEWRSR